MSVLPVCPHCEKMTARTPQQLDDRLRSMACLPHVQPPPCAHCGTTHWAYVVVPRPDDRPRDQGRRRSRLVLILLSVLVAACVLLLTVR